MLCKELERSEEKKEEVESQAMGRQGFKENIVDYLKGIEEEEEVGVLV